MADLVLWNGDPLEIQSRVEKVWIHGKLVVEQ
jgi:imidazolonepropionase-like amidohydrolase